MQIVAEQAALYGIRAPAKLPPAEQYISPNEAGRILSVTGEAVKQWIYHRRLPATKLSNGYWKIRVGDLEEFLNARQDLGHKRILLIDNAGAQVSELASAIEKAGHQPVIAHNAADALLKASDQYPALFVINVSMTQADAWKLMEKIRQTRNIKTIPILIVSDADLKDTESDRAIELGAQGFLRRPLKPQTIIDEITRILGRIL
ncbi:MAG: response regulator [Planctomycetota bacterium]|nr:response regulator [Planctomycetota bacterium]